MAQRRSGAWRRAMRRYGMAGSRLQLSALLALGGVAAGAGVASRMAQQALVVERSDAKADSRQDEAPETVEAGGASAEAQAQLPDVRYIVHVDGAVGTPGIVDVSGPDVRVADAVEAAGGLADDADTSSVNLAEPLVDGAKIHIPHEGELAQQGQASALEQVSGQASTSGATGAGEATVLVNINTATAEELQTLSGVGEVTARAIVDERERNGPYATPEDLMRVTGIGEKKFEKVRDAICV